MPRTLLSLGSVCGLLLFPPLLTAQPFRFAVIGDYGLAGHQEADVATLVHTWSPRLVITTGDNNYSSGAATTIDPNHTTVWTMSPRTH